MNTRQSFVLRISSSIAVGALAFFLTLLIILPLGAILLSWLVPLESETLLPPQFVASFVVSLLVGSGVAAFAGIKYYRYLGKS